MTISGAGSVSSNGGAIGDGAGISSEVANLLLVGNGAVSVIGAGSAWANSGELYVGNQGNGTLAIESGGKVTSKNSAIGRMADRMHANPSYHYSSSGSVTVMGAGSSWTIDGRLSLGGDAISGTAGGAGALDIGLGGSLGRDSAFIDWITGATPADDVPDALARLFTRYSAERGEDECFHEWARRTPNAELRATALNGGQR